ncbi:Aluminum-activated malate transporter 1, partial [Morella rubra]
VTFSLTTVSGFRDDEILVIALKRLFTAILGGCVCVIISILVCPVWAGEDLHNLIALNLEELANFLEGFGDEYFKYKTDYATSTDDKSFLQGYKSVLDSKSSEESLADFAHWEPRQGQFRFRHPWKQYLEIGTLTRECAYRIDALSAYLTSDVQASAEFRSKIQEACLRKDADLLSVIPAATVASLLIDVVECTEKIVDSVRELASVAHWDTVEPAVSTENVRLEQREVADKPHPEIECPHVVITITA